MENSVAHIISDYPLFRGAPRDTVLNLLAQIKTQKFYTNQLIYEKNDISSSLLFLLEGSVDLKTISNSGKEVLISSLRPGSVFGTIGFLDGLPREASAVAQSEVTVASIHRADFFSQISNIPPKIWLNLLHETCENNRYLFKNFYNSLALKPEFQIIEKILDLIPHKNRDQKSYVINISHEALANMVGMARESVSKYLSDLEDKKHISKMRGAILINDIHELMLYVSEAKDD